MYSRFETAKLTNSARFSTNINLLHNWYFNKHLLSVVPSPKEFLFSVQQSPIEGRSNINTYQNQKNMVGYSRGVFKNYGHKHKKATGSSWWSEGSTENYPWNTTKTEIIYRSNHHDNFEKDRLTLYSWSISCPHTLGLLENTYLNNNVATQ